MSMQRIKFTQQCVVCLIYIYIILFQLTQSAPPTPSHQLQLRAELNPQYMKAMTAYKRLEQRLPRKELRALTTIGILNGARQAEQEMEKHLVDVVKDLLLNTDMQDSAQVMPKIDKIEQQLTRDRGALMILENAMDLATNTRNVREFRQQLNNALKEIQQIELMSTAATDQDLANRLVALRKNILKQMESMKSLVNEKIQSTLEHVVDQAPDNGPLAKASNKVLHKRNTSEMSVSSIAESAVEPKETRMIKSILSEDDFRHNLVDDQIERRNDVAAANDEPDDNLTLDNTKSKNITGDNTAAYNNVTAKGLPVAQKDSSNSDTNDEDEMTFTGGEGGGAGGGAGLVALISSLSGGEGGSDIGALIGALTGVISTLFGPGGLDIESLISTATSLISGLLAGNKNFGTVLGQYVGTAFDGLSGGGGAVNNGQFIGNFLGTVVASLSADPEDEGPIQPLVFAQNLISSFMEAKNHRSSEEVSGERKESTEAQTNKKPSGGSDSGGFVKQIVSHLVSSVVSIVLNASLGASGGASHGASALFHSSSASKAAASNHNTANDGKTFT